MPKEQITEQKNIPVKGLHTFSICDARSEEAQEISQELENIRIKREFILKYVNFRNNAEKAPIILEQLDEAYQYWKKVLFGKFLLREFQKENLTCTVGRSVLAQRLAGITTYTGTVNYTALGTGTTPAAVGDTKLGTEVYRKALSSGSYLSNVAYIETFFTASETTGTYKEYGNFIDGTGVADSGQLFNHFLQTVTKSSVETMNVQSVFTISDV